MKFKVGDKVKVIGQSSGARHYHHRVGKVVEYVKGVPYPYRVELKGGAFNGTFMFSTKELEATK